ncbi:N(4)-(Beta-N-acetylglucosaminyl)-L-asparaginase-like [Galleria mellonella]|uniref:N(4)-(Beta-N-acetylglucosaminyl)-L-asparaginase- like n=1 Tax=Galleria mellonella TaxID=7137 RepID=A0A6J1WVQ6_GALME|nr:N(4)-(Beta-N-acetylglucosaminyl)-L-asparaginase-like [Galleria mellonella]
MNTVIIFLALYFYESRCDSNIPIVITTWNFENSTIKAWDILSEGGSSLDAIEKGATVCEVQQCDGTVGFGGSPDEDGETTLDALIMDGRTMNVGAVGALRRVKSAISVARHVLEHTKHSFLVGDQATQFALQMGFKEETLVTPDSKKLWMKWHNEDHCQPNFWMNVQPNPNEYCGPYRKLDTHGKHKNFYKKSEREQKRIVVDEFNHDTIGLVAVDKNGDVAAGTSTNGAKFKIPGRIGDSPIPGSGAYADNAVGGAAATGDGDVMLRFLPSFLAVEEMRRGASPNKAARTAIQRIVSHYPSFSGAVIALTKDGEYGAACHGIQTFPYVVQDNTRETSEVITINC